MRRCTSTAARARLDEFSLSASAHPRMPGGAAFRRGASLLARQGHRMGAGSLAAVAPGAGEEGIESIAVGLAMGAWEYVDLKTPPPEAERKKPLTRAIIVADDSRPAKDALARGAAIAAGYEVSRRLAQMPGNLCTPDLLAKTATDIGRRHKMKVTVLGRREMERLKMGSFLCVAQGTSQDPKLVTMEYRKGKRATRRSCWWGRACSTPAASPSSPPTAWSS